MKIIFLCALGLQMVASIGTASDGVTSCLSQVNSVDTMFKNSAAELQREAVHLIGAGEAIKLERFQSTLDAIAPHANQFDFAIANLEERARYADALKQIQMIWEAFWKRSDVGNKIENLKARGFNFEPSPSPRIGFTVSRTYKGWRMTSHHVNQDPRGTTIQFLNNFTIEPDAKSGADGVEVPNLAAFKLLQRNEIFEDSGLPPNGVTEVQRGVAEAAIVETLVPDAVIGSANAPCKADDLSSFYLANGLRDAAQQRAWENDHKSIFITGGVGSSGPPPVTPTENPANETVQTPADAAQQDRDDHLPKFSETGDPEDEGGPCDKFSDDPPPDTRDYDNDTRELKGKFQEGHFWDGVAKLEKEWEKEHPDCAPARKAHEAETKK